MQQTAIKYNLKHIFDQFFQFSLILFNITSSLFAKCLASTTGKNLGYKNNEILHYKIGKL